MSHIETAPGPVPSQMDGPFALHAVTWIRPEGAAEFHRSRRAVAVAVALRPYEAWRLNRKIYMEAPDAPVVNLRMQALSSLPVEGDGQESFLCHAPVGEGYVFMTRVSSMRVGDVRAKIAENWPGASVEVLPPVSPLLGRYEDAALLIKLLTRDGMPMIAEAVRLIASGRSSDNSAYNEY